MRQFGILHIKKRMSPREVWIAEKVLQIKGRACVAGQTVYHPPVWFSHARIRIADTIQTFCWFEISTPYADKNASVAPAFLFR